MVTGAEVITAIETVLKVASEISGPELTEKELVGLVIDFANDGTLSGPLLYAPGVRLMIPIGIDQRSFKPSPADVMPTDHLSKTRAILKADISAAIDRRLTTQRADRLIAARSQVVAVPSPSFERKGERHLLRIHYRYLPKDLEAILAFAVLLLRDDSRGLGEDLHQCELERCRRFFFSSDISKKTGKRRKEYCSQEHMQEAHKATGADRTRAWRERVKKAAASASRNSTRKQK